MTTFGHHIVLSLSCCLDVTKSVPVTSKQSHLANKYNIYFFKNVPKKSQSSLFPLSLLYSCKPGDIEQDFFHVLFMLQHWIFTPCFLSADFLCYYCIMTWSSTGSNHKVTPAHDMLTACIQKGHVMYLPLYKFFWMIPTFKNNCYNI